MQTRIKQIWLDDYVKVQQLALAKEERRRRLTNWSKEKITDTYIKLND